MTDKIFLLGTSAKMDRKQTQIVFFDDEHYEEVLDINRSLANFAYRAMACKDEAYLKRTITDLMKVK